MIVLTPTTEQYNNLNNYEKKSSKLIFVKDGSDKWIVGLEVLEDENFIKIREQLSYLQRVEYTPIIEEKWTQ
tara:strand:+ start:378 stop:593 length:216 start_codon:yes stop_codon:yes gene_type:complete